jgi:hypothetical protein
MATRTAVGGERVSAARALRLSIWLPLSSLALITVALRLPLLAPRLAHWDAVNYALGLHSFDVAAHQPHPPGSPYFILLGRAALLLVGDDNAALQLVSVVASAAAVLLQYTLARTLFGARAGWLAALLLLTQPVFWGYGTTASAWTVLALCANGIALVSLRLLRGDRRLIYPSAVLLGVVSGLRADAAAFLGPLWMWCLCQATTSWRQRALAVAVVGATTLAWLVPVAATAGGPLAWFDRLLALLPPSDTSMSTEARQLAANTAIAFGTLAFTVVPPLLLSPRTTRTWFVSTLRSQTGAFLSLWLLPAFTFLWLVDSTEPGHDLVFIGAIEALCGGLLAHVARSRALPIGALLASLQAAVFLFAAPLADRPLAWTANSMLLNVTAPGLRQQQTSLDATLQTIRTQFSPTDTVVLTLLGQDAYRFMMYYLPEYSVMRLDPSAHTALKARERTQGNWTPVSGCLLDPATTRNAVVVLMAPIEPGTLPPDGERLSTADGPFQVWLLPRSTSAADYLGFSVGRCA